MTVDREQIRRDAEDAVAQTWAGAETPVGPSIPSSFQRAVISQKEFARHCLALLGELEQAERERDEAAVHWAEELGRLVDANEKLTAVEARLAAADTLAEAAKEVLRWYDSMPGTGHAEEVLRMRLTAYQREQGE